MSARGGRAGRPFVDWRLGGAPVYHLVPPGDAKLRTPDLIKRCVGFVGIRNGFDIEYAGTCFLVAIPAAIPERVYVYLCTAAHVAEKLDCADWAMRFNGRDGNAITIDGTGSRWWLHPDDALGVDFAVMPLALQQLNLDAKVIPVSLFATSALIAERGIGEGDELFVTGLFTKSYGNRANLPIVRMGNIARVATEPLPWDGRMVAAHLIESRSIGGLSGSPVFVRETFGIEFPMEAIGKPISGRKTETIYGLTATHWLFGSVIGHWDTRDEAVNMGISLVVPCDQMLEVLNHPDLSAARAERDAKMLGEGSSPD